MSDLPTIYCYVNGRVCDDYALLALAPDGKVLAQHICSGPAFFHHDMGLTSNWKHDRYAAHYPDGYQLEWVEHPESHPQVQAIIEEGIREIIRNP